MDAQNPQPFHSNVHRKVKLFILNNFKLTKLSLQGVYKIYKIGQVVGSNPPSIYVHLYSVIIMKTQHTHLHSWLLS